MGFMEQAYARVKGSGVTVVYPEGVEERAIRAAAWLVERELVKPVLLGDEDKVCGKAKSLGVTLDGVRLRDPARDEGREAFARAARSRAAPTFSSSPTPTRATSPTRSASAWAAPARSARSSRASTSP